MRLVTRLHQWDVLRANKAPFAWGLETRVPFLDKQFLQVGLGGASLLGLLSVRAFSAAPTRAPLCKPPSNTAPHPLQHPPGGHGH